MAKTIPAPVIAVLSEVLPEAETHAGLNRLFMHAGAPGDPPVGVNKQVKVQEWLRQTNKDASVNALEILGRLMMVTKQMDMIMLSDEAVDHYYQEFLELGYNLNR